MRQHLILSLFILFLSLSFVIQCSGSGSSRSRPFWPPNNEESFRKIWTCPCSNVNLCAPLSTPPVALQEVLAFSISSSYDDWKGYDWDVITTVALFDVGSKGVNELPPATHNNTQLDILCMAHEHQVKTVFGVAFPIEHLANSEVRNRWVLSWFGKDRYPLVLLLNPLTSIHFPSSSSSSSSPLTPSSLFSLTFLC
jgi:hypothetical protein